MQSTLRSIRAHEKVIWDSIQTILLLDCWLAVVGYKFLRVIYNQSETIHESTSPGRNFMARLSEVSVVGLNWKREKRRLFA